ncbi:Fe-S cluster assembly ATPase SufC [Candidatus Dojkabacteria bacterium]|uniref:Fe-S cluster assembly ATPase SufC n=1 Tax=Candidatus Dojkabacteria bacterium TaxID=2099670 RepID=A0A955L7Q7_9BACT|nr:Fe-S cluster assembly ATPase SufC [Candidatus Dojkabacteria bacterium]
MLEISDIHVEANSTKILNGVTLQIKPGEIHVLMGPNGSGKSTLTSTLMGHPNYECTHGKIVLDTIDITEAEPHERSREGLFVAMQYPTEVPGVNLMNFLRLAYNARQPESKQLPVFKFKRLFKEKLDFLGMSEDFMNRNLNEGFSGGEKKKAEILQLAVLEPKYAILDETDSGLDVDALRIVFEGVQKTISEYKKMGVLIITHYERIFDYISPDHVHIMKDGKIITSGGMELVKHIHEKGYE